MKTQMKTTRSLDHISKQRVVFICLLVGNQDLWIKLSTKPMGAYHLTKNFEIFETGTNVTEISWGKFQKIRKLLKFQKANHSTKNSGNSGMKVKWDGNFQEKFFENLSIPHEVVLFSGKLWKSLNISKANKSSGESAIFNF